MTKEKTELAATQLLTAVEVTLAAAQAEFEHFSNEHNAKLNKANPGDPEWKRIVRDREFSQKRYEATLQLLKHSRDQVQVEEKHHFELSTHRRNVETLSKENHGHRSRIAELNARVQDRDELVLRCEKAEALNAELASAKEKAEARIADLDKKLAEQGELIAALGGTKLGQKMAKEKKEADTKKVVEIMQDRLEKMKRGEDPGPLKPEDLPGVVEGMGGFSSFGKVARNMARQQDSD